MSVVKWIVIGQLWMTTIDSGASDPAKLDLTRKQTPSNSDSAPVWPQWQLEYGDGGEAWKLAFQIQGATYSSLGATGTMRDTSPTFGYRSGHAAKNYHRSRGYARAYHTPPPLITSNQVARMAVRQSVRRTTFGGRGRW